MNETPGSFKQLPVQKILLSLQQIWMYNGWIIILLWSLLFRAKILCPIALLLWIVYYNSSYPINIRYLIYGWSVTSKFSKGNLWEQLFPPWHVSLGFCCLWMGNPQNQEEEYRSPHKALSSSKGILKTIMLVCVCVCIYKCFIYIMFHTYVPITKNIKEEERQTPGSLCPPNVVKGIS